MEIGNPDISYVLDTRDNHVANDDETPVRSRSVPFEVTVPDVAVEDEFVKRGGARRKDGEGVKVGESVRECTCAGFPVRDAFEIPECPIVGDDDPIERGADLDIVLCELLRRFLGDFAKGVEFDLQLGARGQLGLSGPSTVQ